MTLILCGGDPARATVFYNTVLCVIVGTNYEIMLVIVFPDFFPYIHVDDKYHQIAM